MFKLRDLVFAIVLVAACAASAYADKPPQYVLTSITSTSELIYEDKCVFHEQTDINCLIYFDHSTETGYLIFFDEDESEITLIIRVTPDKKETQLWPAFL